MLTNLEILNITETIDKAEISFSHLRDELIDHVCCEIEYQMEYGANFQQAFEGIKSKIGIYELQKVQENTLLLIDKQYRIMKTTMKIFGVISPILMAIGALFKIEHWPAAGIILTLGFFLLTFLFLPSAVYVSYRELSNRTKLFIHLTGFFSGFLFAVSFLFKIQHWPGTSLLLIIAGVIAGLCFIPAYFINQIRSTSNRLKKFAFVCALFGSVFYLSGFIFKVNHWPGASLLLMGGAILLLIITFPVFTYAHYKEYHSISPRFIFLCFAVVWFVVPTLLISLNISSDVFVSFKTEAMRSSDQLQYLNNKNINLCKSLLKEASPDIKKKILSIDQHSAEVINYIQGIKMNLVNQTEGTSYKLEFASQMDIKSLSNYTRGDVVKNVLLTSGEANKIKGKIEHFKYFMTNLEVDSISSKQLNRILNKIIPQSTPDRNNSWEEFYLIGSSLISTLDKIQGLQEDILFAENIALQGLIKVDLSKKDNF